MVPFPGMCHINAIIARISMSMSIIFNILAAFMFSANLDRGKTEVVLRLVGPNVAQVKQQLIDDDMTIRFASHCGEQRIRVVNNYTHLGQSTTANCTRRHEIAARRRTCNSSLGPIAAKCFEHPGVPVEKKISIARGHLFSRIFSEQELGAA